MKILLAHNFYRSSAPSGEDAVYRNERALLEQSGVEVIPYERCNDDIDETTLSKRMRLAFDGAWSRPTYNELSTIIRRERPDVAHFHNTFPLISPSAYAACRDNGIPVVQTLHNFRLICPNALLMRNGRPCEKCFGTTLLPALQYRCYRNSFLATFAQVWTITSNRRRGAYRNLVNRYLALTPFAADRLIVGGLPAERVTVKPNFLPDPPAIGDGNEGYGVYVGRLSEEKGVRTLMNAWKGIKGIPLKVAGDGPLFRDLQQQAAREGIAVEFLGFRGRQEILALIRGAAVQIVPSECYEGFPMVILEAYACGTPVIGSGIGSLNGIVLEGETGLKFQPGDSRDLSDKVNLLLSDRERLATMRVKCRTHFEMNFTSRRNWAQLQRIYIETIDAASRQARSAPSTPCCNESISKP